MRGLFVTGTDTGVGKTILSATLLAAMSAAGEPVRAHKPIITGLDEPPDMLPAAAGEMTPEEGWPPDHVLLATTAGMTPEEVSPLRYGPAVSPHLATRLAGEQIDPDDLLARARRAGEGEVSLIVEGVGGLLTPLADDYAVRDLAVALGLPVLIAARPGLGTINHTLLTLEAARAVGLDVRAVVLTPWPAKPSVLERSNRESLTRLGDVEVPGLGYVPSPTAADLASIGDTLPWRRWCPPENFTPSDS
ncbi:MAG TPA: dethiobiotin synthase [Solirubrobacteraceae bacterium]|jgi:dethiobiotin synthetase